LKSAEKKFDLVIIGSGPGGQRAAFQAAKAGKSVAIVERDAMGGGCLHWGTLPSKSFRESVYRWSIGSRRSHPDIKKLFERKNRVIKNEVRIIEDQLVRNNIEVIYGDAVFAGDHRIDVTTKKGLVHLQCEKAVIATGARPVSPDFAEVDGERVLDSNTILLLSGLPKSMVVLGGGIIGCEYASMLVNLGVQVTLIDKRAEILANVDREIVCHMVDQLASKGMRLVLERNTKAVHTHDTGVIVRLLDGEIIEAEACFIALGRQGNTEALGLDTVGLTADGRGLLKVDQDFKTSVDWIYAVGDVIGFPALASTSMEQGRIAVCHAFDLKEAIGKMSLYPIGIYTIPEISTVGKSEEELVAEGIPYVAGRVKYKELARGQIVNDEWGFLKMLVHRDTQEILGVHIIGDSAADLIHIGQAVMILGGRLSYFIENVFNYPTFAEAYKSAGFNAMNQLLGRPSVG
jgi:NAD(P) transhydrogenase